jgi:adenosylhomocysteine nucleosidase
MAVIGIMSALHEELAAVLADMPDEQRVLVAGRDFWVGHWQGHAIVAVLSRIGKVAAATTATVMLERFGVDALVFTGVAGGLGPGVHVGDVVVASGFIQHDMDASPLFPRHEVPLYGRALFEADAVLSLQLAEAAQQVLQAAERHLGPETLAQFQLSSPKVHQGLIVSGDRFVSTHAESQRLWRWKWRVRRWRRCAWTMVCRLRLCGPSRTAQTTRRTPTSIVSFVKWPAATAGPFCRSG